LDKNFSYNLNNIILNGLVETLPLKVILNNVRRSTDISMFVLDLDSKLLLYSAEKPLSDYFPHAYSGEEEFMCYGNQAEAAFYKIVKNIFNSSSAQLLLPTDSDPYYSVFYPIEVESRPAWILVCKFEAEALFEPVKEAAATLALVCKSELREPTVKSPIRQDITDIVFARELLLYDGETIQNFQGDSLKSEIKPFFDKSTKTRSFRGPFAIAAFCFRDLDDKTNDFTLAMYELQNRFPSSFSLVHGNILLAFFYNAAKIQLEELEDFCYQQQLYAGISDLFEKLEDRRFFKQQALSILKIGQKAKPQGNLFHFMEFYTELILEGASERFGTSVLVLSDIYKLADFDLENKTAYLDTLEEFLKNGASYSAAAKALFIDRSTIKYRLKKIYQILQIDFEQPQTAAALLASIYFYRIEHLPSDH